jgi:hypothetical protein
VKVRALFSLAAVSGLAMPAAINAQQPAPLPLSAAAANPNQQLADSIASRIRAADLATGADIRIVAHEGTVYLNGSVRDTTHKNRLVAEVKAVTGVIIVCDSLETKPNGIVRIQDAPIAGPIAPSPFSPIAIPNGDAGVNPGANPVVEPAPVGLPGQVATDMQAPPLPPYAWPTYAPYNNASRIAYPQAYPYNAFPFIGPYYPFPKVPLGWRKVTLEWSDGHWYLGRNSAPQDYWRVKFQ